MLSFLVSVLLPIVGVAAKTQSYTLNIVNAKVNPDGFVRSAVTVGGSFPPPLLTANVNDDFDITVNNRLTNEGMNKSTSIVSEEIISRPLLVSELIWLQSTGMDSSNIGLPKWMVEFPIQRWNHS